MRRLVTTRSSLLRFQRSSQVFVCPKLQKISIRQTSHTRLNARPLTSTSVLNEYLPNGIAQVPSSSAVMQRESPSDRLFKQLIDFIRSRQFQHIALALDHSKVRLNNSQIQSLMEILESLGKYSQILSIYPSYRSMIQSNAHLLCLSLQSAYFIKDYELFESLFNAYIQLPAPSSYYFNMALKVFLRTNTELAKQLLYQMASSEFPMDDNTIFEFLRVADRKGTFQTTRFTFDLIRNHPEIPVSDRSYGLLTQAFLKSGNGKEIHQLNAFLNDRQMAENVEVQMACFLHELTSYEVQDIWLKIEQFQIVIINDQEKLRRFYDSIYTLFRKRFIKDEVSKLFLLMTKSGVSLTPTDYKRLMLKHALSGDSKSLCRYVISVVQQEDFSLDVFYFINIWKSFFLCYPDVGIFTTKYFRKFLESPDIPVYWKDEALAKLQLNESNKKKGQGSVGGLSETSSEAHFEMQIDHYLKQQEDRSLILLVNECLREGKRPSLNSLSRVLNGLIRMDSSEDTKIYQLIHQLYSYIPLDIEIMWLKKEIKHHEATTDHRALALTLLKDFVYKHTFRLTHLNLNQLALLAIDLKNPSYAIELVSKARLASSYKTDRMTHSLFITTLKALAFSGYSVHYMKLFRLIVEDRKIPLSSDTANTVKKHKRLMSKILSQTAGSSEDLADFLIEFDEVFHQLRTRIGWQQRTFKKDIQRVLKALDKSLHKMEQKVNL